MSSLDSELYRAWAVSSTMEEREGRREGVEEGPFLP